MSTKTTDFYWGNYTTQVGFAGQAALDNGFAPPKLASYTKTTDSFTGAENRNWRNQVRSAANATTNASGSGRKRFGLPPQYYVFGYVGGSTSAANARRQSLCLNNILAINLAQAGSDEEAAALNDARTDFSKKIDHIYTSFQGGVFLAELRETLHMIRRPGQSLRKRLGEYLGIVHKNARSLKRKPKAVREKWLSNTWLEYSFGWAPLLNDLDDARQFLQRRQDILYKEVKTTKSIVGRLALREEANTSFTVGPATISMSRRSIDEYTIILAGGVASTASNRTLITQSALGLAPRNFVPTLWEVIPWSFVVDYFTNVGDVLTAWSNQRCALAWGRETRVRKRVTDFIDQRGTNNLTKVVEAIFIPSSQKAITSNFIRVPITTPPRPSLAFEIPGFGTKWINMGALLAARRSIASTRLWS